MIKAAHHCVWCRERESNPPVSKDLSIGYPYYKEVPVVVS